MRRGQVRLARQCTSLWCWMIRRRFQQSALCSLEDWAGVLSVREEVTTYFKEGRTFAHQQEIVILRFRSEVLEDGLFPVPLHVIPVINHSMSDRIMYPVARRFGICQSFIADEEIEVFDPSFWCQMPRFRRYDWCTRGLRGWSTRCYRGREYTS